MDETVFLWFNSWNGYARSFDSVIYILQTTMFKAMPFMLSFWALWFWPKTPERRTEVREALTAALMCSVPIIGITRAWANFLPFSSRPIHTPGLEINLFDGQIIEALEGWSSMPSDHASLFFGFAVALFLIHRPAGLFLMLWAICVSSLPRIVVGLHWPSDIVVGWIVGAGVALLLMRPLTYLVRTTGIVRFFEAREMLGYPVLFFATVEFVRMFTASRNLIEQLVQ